MVQVLFVSSEAHPLVKTGGLGDVSGSLPAALRRLGNDVRLVLPAYRQILAKLENLRIAAFLDLAGYPVRILESALPDSGVPVWLVDSAVHFDREGAPYTGPKGDDWPDNAERFATFSRAAVELAMDRAGLHWRPEVVHCNDWQSGLVPALLSREKSRPATLFTIHNLAYQGLFPADSFKKLKLSPQLWSSDGLEFYGQLSLLKGGLAYADRITTVSPTYAEEIRTPLYGYGLEGLLNYRADRLVGILNGADYQTWDPAHDPLIPKRYSAKSLRFKAENKKALQERFGLPLEERPLLGLVGRLVEQKGVDLLLAALPQLCRSLNIQAVVLGTGDRKFEQRLKRLAAAHPDCVAVHVGYDEALAHLVEAGSDMFLMPSRFEPCGLNQIYSLRYGTAPIVRRTGGLADTVVDATQENLASGSATGFLFDQSTVSDLVEAVKKAVGLYGRPRLWRRLQATAMTQDFSWESSAEHYLKVYAQAVEDAANWRSAR